MQWVFVFLRFNSVACTLPIWRRDLKFLCNVVIFVLVSTPSTILRIASFQYTAKSVVAITHHSYFYWRTWGRKASKLRRRFKKIV